MRSNPKLSPAVDVLTRYGPSRPFVLLRITAKRLLGMLACIEIARRDGYICAADADALTARARKHLRSILDKGRRKGGDNRRRQ